jgi:hypothetical protein
VIGESLPGARIVSIVVGTSTIVMTFVMGRRWFSGAVGILAAGLLTISPYFIGFSRTAMTEGDAFCPLLVLVVLLTFEEYVRWRDSRRMLMFAVTLGLALATKFYLVFLVPALLACDLVQRWTQPRGEGDRWEARHSSMLVWIAAALMLELIAIGAAQTRHTPLSIVLWAVGLLGGVLASRQLIVRGAMRWPVLATWPAILALAATVCFAVVPAHVLQPAVIRTLGARLLGWDGLPPGALFADHVRLYSGILLLKLGMPLGILSVAALIWAGFRAMRNSVIRLGIVVLGVYIMLLTSLPLRQPFYLMSVYPLLALLLGGFIVEVTHVLWNRAALRCLWIALVTASFLWLIWGHVSVYPEFGLYGYETIGNRWLGAESRGYRNIIQVTNDGTEDALRWLIDHLPAGARVGSYLLDYHVIEAFIDQHSLPFELLTRHQESDWTRRSIIESTDYLLESLNNVLDEDTLPVESRIAAFELIHTVWRGRGQYRMPMVQIYKRREGPLRACTRSEGGVPLRVATSDRRALMTAAEGDTAHAEEEHMPDVAPAARGDRLG